MSAGRTRRRHAMRVVCMLLAALWAGPVSAQIRSVVLQKPARDFGYFVGDLLSATSVITTGPDTVLDSRSLPPPGPVSASIDIRSADFSTTAIPGGQRVEIRVTYQNFFSPEQVLAAGVPGYTMAFDQHGKRLSAAVPGFGFAVSPFRHDVQPVIDKAALRPDHPALLVDTTQPERALVAGGAIAILSLALLGALSWRPRRHGPFAQAAGRLHAGGASHDSLLTLHRAFDATAGTRLLADDLDSFLATHSHFSPLRTEIEGFFATSRDAFFGGGGSPNLCGLAPLCRALAQAERRA